MLGSNRYQSLIEPDGVAASERSAEAVARREDLKILHSETAVERQATVPEPSPAAPVKEAGDYMDEWEAAKAAKIRELDALVASGKIGPSERIYRSNRFDNEWLAKMTQAELAEAREIAAEVRAREEAEQASDLENGPER